MPESVRFLTVEQVRAIHRRMLDEFGGSDGLRDAKLLESAAAMPMASFGGQLLHEGTPAIAAVYLFHLCRNHAFIDGNKRTALASAVAFLYANGLRLEAKKVKTETLTLGVAGGTVSKDEVTEFFRRHAITAKTE